jgi:hypothetical protein
LVAEGVVLRLKERCRVARDKLALKTDSFDLVNGELAEEEKVLQERRRVMECGDRARR